MADRDPGIELPAEEQAVEVPKPKRRWGRLALMLSLPLALIIGGVVYWRSMQGQVSTDNAYVQQDKVTIAPVISGRVASVAVRENDRVKAGDTLFSLDREPFEIAQAQTQAAVAAARLQVEQLRAAHKQATVDLQVAQDATEFQQKKFQRQQDLLKSGVASTSTFEQAQNDYLAATQRLTQAQEKVQGAVAALGGDATIATDAHPLVLQALASAKKAAFDLANTTVKAPADGIVTQADHLQVGQYVTPATAVFSLMETGRAWIEANFKETDLLHMAVGQKVSVTLDAYPDRPLEATVASIGAGTGAQFAVIPPQNATGNWIKVVQRVPVRLAFSGATEGVPLIAGLSAGVAVDTGHVRSLFGLSLTGSAFAAGAR